ncbi:hypothetical protein SESBI_40268, partial [Sesbania bispinosa]
MMEISIASCPEFKMGLSQIGLFLPSFTAVHPRRPSFCRTHSMPISLEESALQSEDNSSEDVDPSTDSEEEILEKPLTSEQVMALLADTERAKLTKKLSEANQQNRFLKRQ